MTDGTWIRPHQKVYGKNDRRKARKKAAATDDLKSAHKDEKQLKQKKKRLTLDWFFKPQGDW